MSARGGGQPLPVRPARPLVWRLSVHDQHDALERALANCLRIFSDLAEGAGESDRARRLHTAAELLQPTPVSLHGSARESSESVAPIAHLPRRGLRRNRCSLTERELQVARLIAEGNTNRQIAADLEMSERTADTHVQNILNRLGLVSRAQVAAWIAARDQ